MASYWEQAVRRRTTRRTALAGGASLAGAAAVLAACGGGGGGSGVTEEQRIGLGKLVYDSTDAETPVKRGGTVNYRQTGDIPSMDPYRQIAGIAQTFAGHIFGRLMKYSSKPGLDPRLTEKEPDVAERFEVADGGLTYTFKIRPNVKFHPATASINTVPGLNGRVFDAEDVVASYERFKNMPSPQYQQSFGGKVASVSAPDKTTVVWKLTTPNAIFPEFVTSGQFLWLMGKEAGVAYDPLQKAVGTGPWLLQEYLPSSRWLFKRHPDFYMQGLPHIEGEENFIVPEVSAYLAQFQIGTFATFVPGLAGDMKSLAEGTTDRRLYKGDVPNTSAGIGFGRGDPDSAFLKDARMRRAVSLAMDRATLIEVVNDADAWKELGLEREYAFTNFVPQGLRFWWTDPRGAEMKDSAQWFAYDPQKAKQLVSASGFPNGYETEMHFAANNYAQIYRDHTLLIIGQLKEVGINAKAEADDYGTVHNIRGSAGELPGMVAHQNTSYGDPSLLLDYLFAPGTSRNMMKVDDPIFNALNEKQRVELDQNRRRDILVEMYRHLGSEMRFIPHAYGSIANYTVGYNWYRNFFAYKDTLASQGEASESRIQRWLSNV
jgi:peptide/nickel transport system substrate-binding protein